MRMSRAYVPTLRDDPNDAETAGHRLLLRAGFIHPLAAGLLSFLPLGLKVKTKIEALIREEMDRVDAQEVLMPMVQPAEIWKESGRWDAVGPEMLRFEDRRGAEHCLSMTNEETVTHLVRGLVKSYKQLPLCLYHVQTKYRDEPRARAGLIRVREFTMKDAYSFHADEACLDEYYPRVYQAYVDIFRRAGLEVVAVASDTGIMGGEVAHEFMALTEIGEDTLLLCDACGYAANRQVARREKPVPEAEEFLPLEKVATPECKSIEEVAGYLSIPTSRTAKAVFFVKDEETFVFALVRGDTEVNETKLVNLLGARSLRPAQEEEIRAVDAEPGYASPVGLTGDCLVVVDELVSISPNLVGGANEEGHHLRNINLGRDYQTPPELVADITAVQAGDACVECGAPLRTERGVEVGNIFKLGTKYTEAMGATVLNREGRSIPMVMGCYGIGPGRMMGTVAEVHRDDDGLIWPASIAPYDVHLLSLAGKNRAVAGAAEELYQDLLAMGLDVLLDDRDQSPGEKFADADLIGIPLRLTLGNRGLKQGAVDLKLRRGGEVETVPLKAAPARVAALRTELLDGLRSGETSRPTTDEEGTA